MKVIPFLVVIALLVSCNEDEPSKKSRAELVSVTSINLKQISFEEKTSDIQLTFNRAIEESSVIEYRAFLIKGKNKSVFDFEEAESIESGGYISISPTGSNIQMTLPPGVSDTDRETLEIGNEYVAFVLSVVDESKFPTNVLSDPSNTIAFQSYHQNLSSRLEEIAISESLPSLSVLLIKNNEEFFRMAWGKRNITTNKNASDQTVYYLASISKVITAIAAQQLVEVGKLDLDEDISVYLPFTVRNPNYPDDKITVRQLLGHRSSLGNKNYGVFPDQTAPPMYPAIEHILVPGVDPRYEADIWRNVAPGADYLYSNVTTALLGYLIQEISETDYNEYCKTSIFSPLDMLRTSHDLMDLPIDSIARPYVNGQDVGLYSVEFYPSGMLKSSVDDLSKLAQCLINGGSLNENRILSQESVDEMFTLHNTGSPIGFIWYKYNSLGGIWGHAGWFRGYQTMFLIDPASKSAGIILANSSTPPNNPMLFDGEITKLVSQELLK